MEKRGFARCGLFCLVVVFLFISFYSVNAEESDLGANSLLLKVSLRQGESLEKDVIVSDPTGGEFSVEITGLKGVSSNRKSIFLSPGEKASLGISFNSSNIKPGAYVGKIIVGGKTSSTYIPVIYEIESRSVLFDVVLDIPPAYTEVGKGGRLVAQVKVYDLSAGGGISEGQGSTSIDLEYQITGFDGRVMSSESDSIIVQKQAQITKPISFPEDISEGDYVMTVLARYGNSTGVSSQMFYITNGAGSQVLNFSGGGFFILLGAVVILIFALIIFFVYMIHDRDKMFVELKRINSEELEKQRQFLAKQQEVILSRRVRERKGVKRKFVLADVKKEIRKEVKQKIKSLREKHRKRVREYGELRKKGDLGEMKRKLSEWKAKGYNTLPLDYKLRDLTSGEMKEIMGKWKKKYS
jgi:hypothetical protein